jgi:hypothetical protein
MAIVFDRAKKSFVFAGRSQTVLGRTSDPKLVEQMPTCHTPTCGQKFGSTLV